MQMKEVSIIKGILLDNAILTVEKVKMQKQYLTDTICARILNKYTLI